MGVVIADGDAVLDLDIGDNLGDELVTIEAAPALFGGLEQL